MRKWLAILVLLATGAAPGAFAQHWPIQVHGRYFVDSTGAPWLMVGDNSGYNVLAYETMDRIDAYFADRAEHGFNTVWMNVILGTGSQTPASAVLNDGTPPFTSPSAGQDANYNFATPNPAYWAQIDLLVTHAAHHGLVIAMIPFETGMSKVSYPPPQDCSADAGTGWLTAARAQDTIQGGSITAMYNYGVFLGNRYKNSPNVMWVLGYDFQTNTCTTGTGPNDATLVAHLLSGIKSANPDHVISEELNFETSYSTENSTLRPYMSANGVYSYGGIYDEVLQAYNNAEIPAFLIEGNWEFQNNTRRLSPWPLTDNALPCGEPSVAPPCPAMNNPAFAQVMRLQWWWTMTSGGAGFFYGNPYGSNPQGVVPGSWWPSGGLDTAAIAQLKYVTNFFGGILWQFLVPDQNHSVVTAGYGTYCGNEPACQNQLSNDYVTAAWNPKGTLAVIYNPQGNTLTIDLSKFAGPVAAYWYDPSKGSYAAIDGSPFTNNGSRSFSTPGKNSAGLKDWVLLLMAKGT